MKIDLFFNFIFMKKKGLAILLSVILVLVVGGTVIYATGAGGFLQGKIFKSTQKCNIVFENFDPGLGTVVKYGDPVDFKWNGPGCPKSGYKFQQYLICLENVDNSSAHYCWDNGPTLKNHYTLTREDWGVIHENVKNGVENGQINLEWYVMSYFGDGMEIKEQLRTKPSTFSYTVWTQ